MVTFWARVKNIIFKLKLLILKFGLLLEKLGPLFISATGHTDDNDDDDDAIQKMLTHHSPAHSKASKSHIEGV